MMMPAQKYSGTEGTPQYLDASMFAPQTPMQSAGNAHARALQTPTSYIGELSQLNISSGELFGVCTKPAKTFEDLHCYFALLDNIVCTSALLHRCYPTTCI